VMPTINFEKKKEMLVKERNEYQGFFSVKEEGANVRMPKKQLTMKAMNETYGVCRLDHHQPVPDWAKDSGFYSITRTIEELSIVCSQANIPDHVKCEKDWKMLKVEGPLDFSLIGILSSISTVLAQRKISIFAISTFDTDYILLKSKDFDNAIQALTNEGYEIIV